MRISTLIKSQLDVMMIKLLTQQNCSQCRALEAYLDKGLRGKYDAMIEVVKREDQPELFMQLVQQHQILSTPALIAEDGDVLRNCSVANVKPFLDKHLNN